jgi:acyl-CoA synthetase (AMP-forming)/AMP-acid ligase II
MFVSTLLARAVERWPRRPALVDGDRVLTYAALGDRVGRLANALRGLGLEPGDGVLDLQSNSHTYVETDLALGVAGLVRVAVNNRLTVDEWSYIAENSGARALVYGKGYAGAAEDLRDRVPSLEVLVGVDGTGPGAAYETLLERSSPRASAARSGGDTLVSLNYSSGTTGRPKGCMRTARNRYASTQDMLLSLFGGALGPDDVWLHAGPITHASGLFVLPHIAAGASQVVLSRFDPEEVVRVLHARGVTGTVLVPTMLERVLAALPAAVDPAQRFPALRRVTYAGAPMAPERIEVARDALAGRLVQFYGLVEAIPPVTVLAADEHAERRLLPSAGRAVLGVALDVVGEDGATVPPGEIGELVVGGDHVMAGYWGLDDATGKAIRDGWLWTGDMAHRDGDGYVTLVDRKGDMIITGGYNVFPREIEEVLAEDPAVAEVAVVGVPDADWGEAVTAFVVAAGGADVDLPRLQELCASRLSSFKKPKTIRVVDDLPKTATGKIARKAVRDTARESEVTAS